jgi:hypothetical protein
MDINKHSSTTQIADQLSQLPGLEITQVQEVVQGGSFPGSVIKVTVLEKGLPEHPLILKSQDNEVAFRLYQQYLIPYQLNSPKEYGYIELNGQRFLVMDFIKHIPTNWEDRNQHLIAVNWLVKKDLITWQNLETIRELDCLGKLDYYGVDYWLPELEKWYLDAPGYPQAKAVWESGYKNQNRLNEIINELNEAGVQTVVHGDLSLDNILFGTDEANNALYVIDWTQPHISSVTKDLADLVDSAPENVKKEIIQTYRNQIDFPHFDEIFTKARVLKDIGYLTWMAWMINVNQKDEIDQSEMKRVATSLLLSLEGSQVEK